MKNFLKYKYPLLLFIIAVLTYANTWKHDYAWDDIIVIQSNERVLAGYDSLPKLFVNIKSRFNVSTYGYRPISLLSFATDIQFFGLNPSVAHIHNTILYGLLCMLLFYFLKLLFTLEKEKLLFWTVLLFAVHPIHTEVVANIKSRDEILCFIFIILALINYIKFIDYKGYLNLLICFVFITFAFFSKENGIIAVPLIGLIYLYKKGFNWNKQSLFSYSLIALLGLIILGLWKFTISDSFLVDETLELMNEGNYREDLFLTNPLVAYENWISLLPQSMHLFYLYLAKFFYPYPLLHDYGYNVINLLNVGSLIFYLEIIGILILFYFIIKLYQNQKLLFFAALFFLLSLFPYLHLMLLGKDIFAERFLFIPSFGLCLFTVLAIYYFFKKVKWPIWPTMLLLALPLLLIAQKRNKDWKNNESLFSADISYLENCARANYNYAVFLKNQINTGSINDNSKNRQNVLDHLSRSKSISEHSYMAYTMLGKTLMEYNRMKEAEQAFLDAIQVYPDLVEPHFLLGINYLEQNRIEKAIIQFKKCLELADPNIESRYYLAVAFLKKNETAQAIKTLEKGLKYYPKDPNYYDLVIRLYQASGRNTESEELKKIANSRFPTNPMFN